MVMRQRMLVQRMHNMVQALERLGPVLTGITFCDRACPTTAPISGPTGDDGWLRDVMRGFNGLGSKRVCLLAVLAIVIYT
jgi:hypothetical protein